MRILLRSDCEVRSVPQADLDMDMAERCDDSCDSHHHVSSLFSPAHPASITLCDPFTRSRRSRFLPIALLFTHKIHLRHDPARLRSLHLPLHRIQHRLALHDGHHRPTGLGAGRIGRRSEGTKEGAWKYGVVGKDARSCRASRGTYRRSAVPQHQLQLCGRINVRETKA